MATGGGDIEAVDFTSPGTPTTVCGNGKRQDEPRVDGDVVVWRDWRALASDGTDIWGSSVASPSPYPVCQAVADQQSPAISGDVVVFADYRDQFLMGSPTRGPDIRFCDLTLGEDGFVCLNSGAQDRPAIDGDRVAWSDWRAGATRPDVWRAVLTPWTAAVWFDGVGQWTDTPLVTLDLYAASKAGAVVEMLVYNRGQSPLPGPVAYGETLSGWDLTTGVSPADGPRTVCAQFLDGAVSSPVVVAKTTLDTTAPVPLAPNKATVVRGSKATLKYRVDDDLAPKATVTIRIKNAGGTTVKTLHPGKVATGKPHSTSFTCLLAKGAYRFVVSARDLAGNGGVPASNTLTVR